MSRSAAALPLTAAALAARDAEGRPGRFWLRDDDAVTDTPALERLIGWSQRARAPVLLAVIPAQADEALARRLASAPLLIPCQHGLSHANHAPAGEKSAEFGPHRPLIAMIRDIEHGRALMRARFGVRAAPVFVPPWNRITADLAVPLAALGFTALSTFGPPRLALAPGMAEINTDLDIIDWRGGRCGRPLPELDAELARHLAGAEAEPTGILTHHLAHDAAAWDFLDALIALPGLLWSDVTGLTL